MMIIYLIDEKMFKQINCNRKYMIPMYIEGKERDKGGRIDEQQLLQFFL